MSVSTTTRRAHLPVAWTLSRMDQVTVCSTSITLSIPLLLFPSTSYLIPSLVFIFWPSALLSKLSFLFLLYHKCFSQVPPLQLLSRSQSLDTIHCNTVAAFNTVEKSIGCNRRIRSQVQRVLMADCCMSAEYRYQASRNS